MQEIGSSAISKLTPWGMCLGEKNYMTIGQDLIEYLKQSGETAIIRSSSNAEEDTEWSIHPYFMKCRSPVRMSDEFD